MVEVVQRDSTATPVTTTTTTTATYTQRCCYCCYNYLYFICITIPIFIYDGIALLLYTIILLPAFIRMIYYYFFIADRTVIKYNTTSYRQTLDIYWPKTTTTTTSTTTTTAAAAAAAAAEDDTAEVCRSNRNHTSNRKQKKEVEIQHRLQSDIRPIIVFVCGGAWMIGYKMWGTLLARVLTYCGITVILPDYRNYPFWGTIPDQINDIDNVLQWIFTQITPISSSTTTGGTTTTTTTTTTNELPTRRKVILVGQSAGGHLVMTLLLRKVLNRDDSTMTLSSSTTDMNDGSTTRALINDSINNNNIHPYHVSDLTGLIVLSAPLDIQSVYTSTFHKHGLSESFMKSMFSPGVMNDYNPLQLLEQIQQQQQEQQLNGIQTNLWTQLPPIKVYHGNCDRTVPYEGSIRFVELFQQLSSISSMSTAEDGNTSTNTNTSNISFHIYEGWSHTDPILEGPMDADHRFHSDIVTTIQDWIHQDDNNDNNTINNNDSNDIEARSTTPNSNNNNIYWPDDETTSPVMKRLCPRCLIRMGRFCMPF